MKLWLIEQKNNQPHLTDYQTASFHDYCVDNPKARFHLTPLENKRTLTQNAFYWVYLTVIARETGNDADDLHAYFRANLLPRKIVKIKGRKGVYDFEKSQSTTELSKAEFGEYMEKICVATEVPIPNPGDAGYYK
ncbi:MAG: hypothetical protein SGJ02_04985 [bacterium]|nr:hypothetical protein [bacterium]